MNNNQYTKQELMLVVNSGTYYYPAYTHYSSVPLNVYCDFCNKSNLLCSIGFGDKDLCLGCVETLTNKNNSNIDNKLTNLYEKMQNQNQQNQQNRQQIITRMMQDSVRVNHDTFKFGIPFIQPYQHVQTKMKQDSVRVNSDSNTINNNFINLAKDKINKMFDQSNEQN